MRSPDSLKQIELTARTPEEALEKIQGEWLFEETEFEYEVLDPGSKGFLKIGSREASVCVRILNGYFARKVGEYIHDILGFSSDGLAETSIRTQAKDARIHVFLEGTHLGRMIGKHGKTISAIQHLANIFVNRLTDSKVLVFVEVGDYKDRRKEIIRKIARQNALQVSRTGSRIQLDPMFAFERRIVHETIKKIPGVKSFSMGLEPYRYVVIEPSPGGWRKQRHTNSGGKRNGQNQG
ncbi:MAG TPA: RNA-binding cell elongation regulator Jag/EloR [Thermotogota bacterium]|nr:RNA-binding cell elongation regulator Jag/EloR [Thermotogota bacterium]HRW91765.1 RNA-binding cell elongation regulator Jag/EloR [Thermotogota bacterium]